GILIATARPAPGAVEVVDQGSRGSRECHGIIVVTVGAAVDGGLILRGRDGAVVRTDHRGHVGEADIEGRGGGAAVGVGGGDGDAVGGILIATARPAPGA